MQLSGRKKEIFDLLCKESTITVAQLARLLYVSEMTIRRDLAAMEAHGFVTRYRGGAVARTSGHLPLSERMHLEEKEKRALCEKAATYLKDGMTVFVDFSSTCQFILPHLKKYSGITLITNSVKTLLSAEALKLPCHLLGGDYCEKEMCLLGPAAERAADAVNVDIAFFSVQGYDTDGTLSDSVLEAVTFRERIIKNAAHTVFLFERAKCGRRYRYTLAPAEGRRLTVIL
jgi:DeoR/GlpR family transcriptional regulator of sugar metabolism